MGRYRLCDVPTPAVALKAIFINYRPLVKDSVALRDSVTVIDFRLVSSPITLNVISIPADAYIDANGRINYIDADGRHVSLTNGGARPPVHLDSAAVAPPVPPPSCRRPR